MELAAELKRQGKTLLDGLDQLYTTFGYFSKGNVPTRARGRAAKSRSTR